jgi:zinc transporter
MSGACSTGDDETLTTGADGLIARFGFGSDGFASGDNPLWNWSNYSLADVRARRAIEAVEAIPAVVRAALLAPDQALYLDYDDGWLHGVIADMHHRHYNESQETGHFHFAFNDTDMVSARRHPLQSVDDVRHLIVQRKKAIHGPAELLELIMRHSLERLSRELLGIGGQLDAIEDRVVADKWREEQARLNAARRRLVFIHRHVAAIASLFRQVRHLQYDDLPEPVADMVDRLASRSEALLADSEQIHSRARLLQDELMAKLSAESNRLLYVLSVLTAMLLPTTIVSGLFGMNVGGVPFSQDPSGFWAISALAVGLAAAVLLFVRRLSGKG